jgi:predicted MFS family arabinose efflux permease
MFQIGLWREYFWLTGIMLFICAILVAYVIKEPKRGSKQNVLKGILLKDSVSYQYKINKETMRKIVLSRTNIVIFIEGIFTWVIFSIAIFLMYPYLQSPPHNISAFMTSILMIIFGLPGAIFGSIAFSKISDKLAEKNVKYRIDLIIFSIVILFFMVIIIFLLPFPNLTPAQGNNLLYLMTLENFILIGIILFSIRATLGIYHINQSPIIQNVNLPESQGTVSAWNQFLETIGMGLGPFIAGIILTVYNQNYLLTAIVSLLVGIPSAFAWLLARRWIQNDIAQINNLLGERADDLVKKSNQANH